jgi:hypothetical protein
MNEKGHRPRERRLTVQKRQKKGMSLATARLPCACWHKEKKKKEVCTQQPEEVLCAPCDGVVALATNKETITPPPERRARAALWPRDPRSRGYAIAERL